jgi:hypothetical protein
MVNDTATCESLVIKPVTYCDVVMCDTLINDSFVRLLNQYL